MLTTGQFLEEYFRHVNTGYAEITYIAPDGVKVYPHVIVQWKPLPVGTVEDYPGPIMTRNKQGYGCYFGTTVSGVKHDPVQKISDKTNKPYTVYPRRKEKDVILLPAFWADIDDVHPLEGMARLTEHGASIVTMTGGGVHGYWLLDEPAAISGENKHEIKRILHGIAKAVGGGDEKVRDLARVLRLPGTVNTKPSREGAICQVIDYAGTRHTYDDVKARFIRFAPRENPTPTRFIPSEAASKDLPAWVNTYLQYGRTEGSRNSTLYGAARCYHDVGLSEGQAIQDLLPRATADGLSTEEATRTIRSAFETERGLNLPSHVSARIGARDAKLKRGAR